MLQYIVNPCEFITVKLLETIDVFDKDDIALVIPDDDKFAIEHGRKPLKNLNDRMMLAESLKKVDYVACEKSDSKLSQLRKTKKVPGKKNFKVGYVPGTFDLLHTGHIELIKIAQSQCEQVVVGVNSDSQVWKNKQKHPCHDERTRMYIMEHIIGVDGVILVETNDKQVANQKVLDIVGLPINAIFYGSDLKGKAINDEGGLNVESIYTPRPIEKMQKISTTNVSKELGLLKDSHLMAENDYLKSIFQQVL